VTHQWLKKAVLLSFRLKDNAMIHAGDLAFYDKVQTKFAHMSAEQVAATGVRVVPPAVARRGSYLARNVVLMPSYVNIGAYVDEGTMVDTWATVGSCAQIGKNVHLSGRWHRWRTGADPGQSNHHRGQLLHRRPLGSGRRLHRRGNSVLGMGVYIGKSTKIYNRATGEISYGRRAGSSWFRAACPPLTASTTCTAL
jgi:2,3,4,5-tetrahydropyridine-2-carboxylate N-succinyltransferase